MTDDLKHKLEQLVADPPPPSAVPSQAVFDRIRTTKRRRTTGALTLAAAAVAAVAVAAGNLADVNSSPPISNTPSAPVTIVTGPPSSTPPATPPTVGATTKATQGTTTTQGATTGTQRTTSTKGAEQPTGTTTTEAAHTPPPVQPPERPISVAVVLKPTVTGRTVSVKVTVSGTVIVPVADGKNLPADTSFLNLSGGTNYTWGDGEQGGSDGGAVQCGGKTRKTGRETYSIETHTYAKPGTYTLRYQVTYCNTEGSFTTTKTAKVTVAQ
jgi:hypothetical protein